MKPIFKQSEINLNHKDQFITIPKDNIQSIKVIFTHRVSKYENPLEERVVIEYKDGDNTKFVQLPKTLSREFYTKSQNKLPEEITSKYSKADKGEYIVDIAKLRPFMEKLEHKGNGIVKFANYTVELKKPDFDLTLYAPEQFLDTLQGQEFSYQSQVQESLNKKDQIVKDQIQEIIAQQEKFNAGEIDLSKEERMALNTKKVELEKKLQDPLELTGKLSVKTESGEKVQEYKFIGIYNPEKQTRDVYILRNRALSTNVIALPKVEFEEKWSPASKTNITGALMVKDNQVYSFDLMRRNNFKTFSPRKTKTSEKIVSQSLELE